MSDCPWKAMGKGGY